MGSPDQRPLVSIVIPVYNGSNFVSEAIDSALSQSYDNFEVVVVNDGSTDNGATAKIARSYGERIRYYEKPNGGVASALNFGIRKMKGDYLSWLSHDDVYVPEKLQLQIEAWRSGLGALSAESTTRASGVVLFSAIEEIDERGQSLGVQRPYREGYELTPEDVLCTFPLHGCTLLIPRQLFEQVGTFDESLIHSQDYDLWFRMLLKGVRFKYLDRVLVKARSHADQGTRKHHGDHRSEADAALVRYVDLFRAVQGINFVRVGIWMRYGKGARRAADLAAELGRRQAGSWYPFSRIWHMIVFAVRSGQGLDVVRSALHRRLRDVSDVGGSK